MSLQWTAVATFLYAEVFAVLLLCVPFVSPKRWNKIFKSRLMVAITTYGNTAFVVVICILVFLLVDAFREVRKYSVSDKVDLSNNPVAIEHIHMKLFRAQRNEYIAGFALLLCLLLRRLAALLSQQASLMASNEAFQKQAEGASDAARRYMEENEKLQEKLREAGVEVPEVGGGKPKGSTEEENKTLKKEVGQLKDELDATRKAPCLFAPPVPLLWCWASLQSKRVPADAFRVVWKFRELFRRPYFDCLYRMFALTDERCSSVLGTVKDGQKVLALQKSDSDVKAMKKQAENLTVEYDRLLEEHANLQAKYDTEQDKKSD
ncbi:hypothetical protein P4O66_022783 [Electrophorus voltai]|uniref:Endoplasmic reticulum transmembrane protein n=1 Tax=Electrophorus voltai TaxID=2609070 RepID=A0AAD8ZN36_9TELE|nr:hypothetical protein P4O66_022783 [Electrophorus voltai]